jgi:hydrogenase maturation protein HypF
MTAEALRVLRQQLTKQVQTHVTSSAGRLLDACAALCGGRQVVTYEGQAAIEFEALAMRAPIGFSSRYVLSLTAHDPGPMHLALHDFWPRLLGDLVQGRDRRSIALDVHSALADAVVAVARRVRDTHGVSTVGLTGGVFQNVLLLTLAARRLRQAGFTTLTHRLVPPNDGGLALGQAMIAAVSVRA